MDARDRLYSVTALMDAVDIVYVARTVVPVFSNTLLLLSAVRSAVFPES